MWTLLRPLPGPRRKGGERVTRGAAGRDIQDDALGGIVSWGELYPSLVPPNVHAVDGDDPTGGTDADSLMVKVCEEIVGP